VGARKVVIPLNAETHSKDLVKEITRALAIVALINPSQSRDSLCYWTARRRESGRGTVMTSGSRLSGKGGRARG
jgi:hypothetical protein